MPDCMPSSAQTNTPSKFITQFLALLICVGLANGVSAQEDITHQLSTELIYPTVIDAGKPFTVYAFVSNTSTRDLHIGVYSSERRFESYGYRRHLRSGQVANLQAGESRYFTVGRYYFAGDTLSNRPITLDDFNLQFSEPGEDLMTAPYVPLPAITINVQNAANPGTANPALYPIPQRQALMLKDLAESGDQLLIHDPNTSYDWIRVGETTQLSRNDVQHALRTHPQLQGFQLARTSQVAESLLNHIHAAGIAAQLDDLQAMPPHQLVSKIADFVRLHGSTQMLGNAEQVIGVTADETPSLQTEMAVQTILSISGHDEPPCDSFYCPALGLYLSSIMESDDEAPNNYHGYWLVRGAPDIKRPTDKTSLLDDQLVIPVLKIEDSYYRAALLLTDREPGLFRQLSLYTVDAVENAVVFDSATGLLDVPDAVLMESDGSASRANLTFRLIPDTMPAVLELVGMSTDVD